MHRAISVHPLITLRSLFDQLPPHCPLATLPKRQAPAFLRTPPRPMVDGACAPRHCNRCRTPLPGRRARKGAAATAQCTPPLTSTTLVPRNCMYPPVQCSAAAAGWQASHTSQRAPCPALVRGHAWWPAPHQPHLVAGSYFNQPPFPLHCVRVQSSQAASRPASAHAPHAASPHPPRRLTAQSCLPLPTSASCLALSVRQARAWGGRRHAACIRQGVS